MTENKMYPKRVKNIPVMRYCGFDCVYCAFKKFQKISSCPKCRAGENHSHMEVLHRTPPRTKPDEFLTVGLSGDVSFMTPYHFEYVLNYCRDYQGRTFLIQSKNPAYFLQFKKTECYDGIPNNVILGTTIETNREYIIVLPRHPNEVREDYQDISKAPLPEKRYKAMRKLNCRKTVTIEPILEFDIDIMVQWMQDIKPEFIYIGYDNHNHKLPEPSGEKTIELISKLRGLGLNVISKTLRTAWWEQ